MLLLTNRKPKKDMIDELSVFLPPKQTKDLVDWLFQEIEILKKERKVPPSQTPTPPPPPSKKTTEKAKKQKKSKKEKKTKKDVSYVIKLDVLKIMNHFY